MSDEAIYKLHTYPSGELEEFEYVQDLVRCKECKHWHKKDDLTYCDRNDYGYGYKADDFCSYGERRDHE